MPQKRKPRLRPRAKNPKSKPKKEDTITAVGHALRALGGLGGGFAGNFIGQPALGASAGTSLAAALSRWLGQGDYSVSKNSLVQRASNNIPLMHNSGQSIVVRHREYIGPISGSSSFTVQKQLRLNPGLKETFPWLSGLADRYQEYKVLGMVYHYVPTSGTYNGSTSALGSVMLQTTYRATDNPPVSKAEMLNEYWATEVVPFDTMVHPIECDPKENPFSVHYVRNSTAGISEILMYDLATTFVATQGMINTDIVGDIWVTYEIELKKPLITSNVLVNFSYNVILFPSPNATLQFLFTGTPILYYGDSMGFTFAGNTITLPSNPAAYTIQLRYDNTWTSNAANGTYGWIGTATVADSATLISIDGITSAAGNPITITSANAATSTSLYYSLGVRSAVGGGGTVTVPFPTMNTGTNGRISMFITRTPY